MIDEKLIESLGRKKTIICLREQEKLKKPIRIKTTYYIFTKFLY